MPRRRKTEEPADSPLYEALGEGTDHDEAEDRRPWNPYRKPTSAEIQSLVGISCDDAFWRCIRESFDLRIHTEDGQEFSYTHETFKLLPGQKVWTGVWINVVNGIVTKAWWSEDHG